MIRAGLLDEIEEIIRTHTKVHHTFVSLPLTDLIGLVELARVGEKANPNRVSRCILLGGQHGKEISS